MIVPFPRATRARFHIVTPRPAPNVVAIIDMCDDYNPSMTVTNDAEAVIRNLKELGVLRTGDRLIYRDSDGQWDELAIDSELRFIGFRALRASTSEEAVQKLRLQKAF